MTTSMLQAATITVDTPSDAANGDGNNCTLREAIDWLNTNTQPTGCSNTGAAVGSNDRIIFDSSLSGADIQLNGTQLSISSESDLHIDASSLSNPVTLDALGNSRVIYTSYTNLEISNLVISNGSTTGSGGGVRAYESNLTLNNTVVSLNQASSGGGIKVEEGTLIVTDSQITQNTASSEGGGIDVSGYSGAGVSVDNSQISNNQADYGAGVNSTYGDIEILNNSQISSNTATTDGGGIRLVDNYLYGFQVSLDNSTVSTNQAQSGNGGGVYANAGISIIDNSLISANQAGGNGGGVYGGYLTEGIQLKNSQVSNNLSTNNGGGIAATYAVKIESSQINSNTADANGGGIHTQYSVDSYIKTSTLNANIAAGNTGEGKGGALYVPSSMSLAISDSTLSNNQAILGGGMWAEQNGAYELSLINCTLSGNTASNEGGGLLMEAGLLPITHCTFANNNSPLGAALNARLSVVTLTNSILADSSSGQSDCYASVSATVNADAKNIIEANACGNTATAALAIDPRLLSLQDNGGSTLTHALSSNSPARNLVPDADCDTEFDQRGKTRKASDTSCDAGAIEFDANDDSNFIIIPLGNGKVAVVPL